MNGPSPGLTDQFLDSFTGRTPTEHEIAADGAEPITE